MVAAAEEGHLPIRVHGLIWTQGLLKLNYQRKTSFYPSLSSKGITDEEYAHGKDVWTTFGCQNRGDYHDLYINTDVLLLVDVFEHFRKFCQEKYGLDTAHYYSAPGLS